MKLKEAGHKHGALWPRRNLEIYGKRKHRLVIYNLSTSTKTIGQTTCQNKAVVNDTI